MEIKFLCILGALMVNLTLGTFYSIGNVIPYVASYMRNNGNTDVTLEHGTWITAAFLLGQGFFMIVGSYVEQKYNSRVACILGCIIHSASTFATMWAINVNFLAVILIYGLGCGIGCGTSYMSSIIAAQKWFPNNKGMFTGIIVAGFGCGGLIFTFLQTLYMNPQNESPNSFGYFEKLVYDKTPKLFLYMGIIFACAQTFGCFLAYPAPATTELEQESTSVKNNGSGTIISEDSLPTVNSFISIFKYKIFYIIGLMMILVAPGVTFVNSLGKRYGQTYIQDDRFLAIVVAVAAIANALGRLTWGFLMEKFSFSTCYSIKVILFATLILLFPLQFVLDSKVLFLVWMLGLFFGFSGTFVLFPVFIEQVFGSKYHGIVYGINYILLAGSSIITSLLIQKTIGPALAKATTPSESTYPRFTPCAVIAVLYIASLLLYILSIPVRRTENAIKRRKENEVTRTKTSLFHRQDLFPKEAGTLAEKTSANAIGANGITKENSLGSIVKFKETPPNDNKNKIKTLGKV